MKKLIQILMVFFAIQGFSQNTHTVDFEDAGVGSDWEWAIDQNGSNPPLEFIDNPVSGGLNTSAKVAKFVAMQAGQPWALTYTDDNGQFTFDESNKIVKILIYKDVVSPVGLKFEGLSPAVELQVTNQTTGQWEELTFDFTDYVGNTYNRLVLIPDFVARTQDNTIYFDDIQLPEGEIVALPEPSDAPADPTHEETDVLSMYTEVYTNLDGINFNPYWNQTTIVTLDYNVAGNNTLKYENLNYQGTEFPNQDVSVFEYIHIDFWTANSTDLNFYLISPGNEIAVALPIEYETWVSVDIPLADFVPPVNLTDVFQFKVDGNGTIFFDNWYFWKEPIAQGTDATLSDLQVDGVTIPGFSPVITSYEYELPIGTTIVPIVTATTNDENASLSITPTFTLPGATQVVVTSEDESNTITYLVSFVIADPEPTTVPDPPPHAAADVMSFYSEAYTNVEGINFNPYWGQQTIVTLDYPIAGNNTLRYENIDFQGTDFPNQDVSEYEYFHVDFWTANATELNFFLISPGPVQQAYALPVEFETWVSVDIPLASFSPPVDLTDLFQFMVTGNGDVWFDNWYFWKEPLNPEGDATLSDLMVDGVTVSGFAPDVLSYSVELPFGSVEVPQVTAVTTQAGASFVVNDALGLPGTTGVVVTSEDESNTLTYTIEFTIGPEFPVSPYCETEVFHFSGEPPSGIYLTIANVDAGTMIVEIESADDDPVDLLLITNASGASISEPNTTVPGKISRTMTWADDPPTDVEMNVLWSKDSFGGNWMLSQENIIQPFLANCGAVLPTVSFNPQDGDTDVEPTVNPVITFSVAVEMADGSEITNADLPGILTFNEGDENGQPVAFTATINDEKKHITLVPDSELAFGQDYYLALGNQLIGFQDGDLIAGESVTFTTETAPKPYLELDVQDNFEDDGFATIEGWMFQDSPDLVPLTITEDPVDPANSVADYNRSGDFLYTNAQVILDHRMDLTQRNEFELKVFFPSSNNYGGSLAQTVALKLQNSLLGELAYTTQTEVLLPVTTLDTWVTVVFDFSTAADSMNYDQIVVQPGGENHSDPGQFYFDDMVLLDGGPRADFIATPLSGNVPLTVQFIGEANFAANSWEWDFDNDGTVDANEQNPEFTYTSPGIYSVRLYASNPFIGNDEEIKENYITVDAVSMTQYVDLPAGWSGLSSFVVPDDASIQSIFGPLADDIQIIIGADGMYFPSQGINTLVDWDAQAGYMIKMLNDAVVEFSGMEAASRTVALPAGWSVAPVTVDCEVNAGDFFAAYPAVTAVKDVAGGGVYWPEKSINTIQTLVPGHAYYILTTEALEITYPECVDGFQLKWSDDFN